MKTVRFLRIENMNPVGFKKLLAHYIFSSVDAGNDLTAIEIHPGE